MSIKSNLFLFFLLLVLGGCKEDNVSYIQSPGVLSGCWINPKYYDSIVVFEKALYLKDKQYGLCFMSGNQFTERKIEGWCGTPPLTYADYTGTWRVNDSVIYITVPYWRGMADYGWKLLDVDEYHLTVIRLFENYH